MTESRVAYILFPNVNRDVTLKKIKGLLESEFKANNISALVSHDDGQRRFLGFFKYQKEERLVISAKQSTFDNLFDGNYDDFFVRTTIINDSFLNDHTCIELHREIIYDKDNRGRHFYHGVIGCWNRISVTPPLSQGDSYVISDILGGSGYSFRKI